MQRLKVTHRKTFEQKPPPIILIFSRVWLLVIKQMQYVIVSTCFKTICRRRVADSGLTVGISHPDLPTGMLMSCGEDEFYMHVLDVNVNCLGIIVRFPFFGWPRYFWYSHYQL